MRLYLTYIQLYKNANFANLVFYGKLYCIILKSRSRLIRITWNSQPMSITIAKVSCRIFHFGIDLYFVHHVDKTKLMIHWREVFKVYCSTKWLSNVIVRVIYSHRQGNVGSNVWRLAKNFCQIHLSRQRLHSTYMNDNNK